MADAHRRRIIKDVCIIVASVFVAIVLAKSGAIRSFLGATHELRFLGSFIAGLFFTSVFTVAPATAVLGQIAQLNSILVVAVLGGAGAVIGDLVIFRFVRDHIAEDFSYLLRASRKQRWSAILHARSARWLAMFIGAVIVASPLPDELGLAMMGISKMKTRYFIPISFLLNASGIFIIGLVAKAIS